MKLYNNMKLQTKLIISFALVALVSVIIGVVGTVSINMLRDNDRQMYEENTSPMADLAAMYDNLASQRICAANVVLFLTADPDFSAEEVAAMAEKEQLFEEALAAYEGTLTIPGEQELFDSIESLYFGEFEAAKAQLRAAAPAGDVVALSAAMNLVDSLGSDISDYVDEAFVLNVNAAEEKMLSNASLAGVASFVQIAVIVFGLLFAVFCALFLGSIISRPTVRIMDVTRQAGQTGDLHFPEDKVAAVRKDALAKDEIGQTAAAFAEMMDSLIAKVQVLEQVADGDLTVSVPKAGPNDTLGNAIEKMVDNLSRMFAEINTATDQVAGGSTQIATSAQNLAQATTEQSATVEQLVASVNGIAEKTQENAQRAEHAASLAGSIRQSAEQGAVQMGRMTQAVEEINAASQSISAVIKVIDDIAFQTNILALNAAVEAARAGEHGKGFAVVADEVRNLAGKSAEAAKDTGKLIADTVEKAELGASIAAETSQSLDTIVAGINESASVVGEIAVSSDAQNQAIGEINKGIDQVSQVVQNNSATAEESAAAAEEMTSQAAALQNMVARFKLQNSAALPAAAAHQSAHQPTALPAAGGDYIF